MKQVYEHKSVIITIDVLDMLKQCLANGPAHICFDQGEDKPILDIRFELMRDDNG
jgi:hypothetical protein